MRVAHLLFLAVGPRPLLLPFAGTAGPTKSGRMRALGVRRYLSSGLFRHRPHPTPLRGATFSREREKGCRGRFQLAALLACTLASPAAAAFCDGSPKLRDAGRRYLILAEGDSITFGQAASDGQGSYVQRACVLRGDAVETIVAAKSRAILGSPKDAPGANSLYGRMAADNAILARKKGKRIAILTVLVGRNDLVGTWGGPEAYATNLAAYVAAMRRAGWNRIVVGTVLPSTWEPFDPQRDTLNLILTAPGWAHAHGIDAIADFALSPEMGGDGQAADKTYFADGIHPTNLGYATLAPIYGRALTQVMAQR